MLENVCSVCYSQLLCYVSYLFHVIFSQFYHPALPVLLQSVDITRFGNYTHFTMKIRFQDHLSRCSAVFCTQLQNYLIFQYIRFSSIPISSTQWSVSKYMDSILLSSLNQTLLIQIWMRLDLENNWFHFTKSQQFIQKLTIKVRDPQMLCIPFFDTQLESSPTLLQRHMQPLLPFRIHVSQRPMKIEEIYIVQLHKSQGLLQFEDRIKINMIKCLGCNEQVFSFASILADDRFNCFTQGNLIIIISGRINVLTISHFQSFPQKGCQQLLILNLISTESNQMQYLFIWQYLSGWAFLFLLIFLFSHFYLNITYNCQLYKAFTQYLFLVIRTYSLIYDSIDQLLIKFIIKYKLSLKQLMIVTISQKFKSSPQKQSPKQFKRNQSYQTPSKNAHQQTAQKTLMKNIIQKISESKRNSSNNKNIKRFKTKSQIIQKDIKQNQNDEMNDEKCIIISNQSANSPGFYQYLDWMKLHAKFLAYVDRRYMDELWKILRLINYGEVQIPTGLVYQIFIQIRKRQDSFGFQRIIDNFLQQNQTSDSYKSFKDVKNYLPITQIEKQYKCIRQEPKVEQKVIRQRCNSSKNVFERNFEVAKVRTIKKISSVCKNLVQEAKQMYQKPKISIYKNQSHNSLIKPERICHHAQKHKYKSQQQRYLQYLQQNNPIEKLFKAKQVDKSLFEGGIDHIPGVLSHLSRNKYCQAEKLRCKRLQQRPQYSKKKIY